MPIRGRHYHDGVRSHFIVTIELGTAQTLKRDATLAALVDVFVVISTVVDVHHMATTGTLTLAWLGVQIFSLLILGYGQFLYWKSTYPVLVGRTGNGKPSISPPVARRALRRELSLVAVMLGTVTFFGALDVADEVQTRHVEWLWLGVVALAVTLLLLYGLVRLIVILPSLRFPQNREASGDLTILTSAGDDVHSRTDENERESESTDS